MSMIEDMEDAPHTVLRCPECAALNLRQQSFCAKCGTPLWRSCLQCGAICPVGENYCGACGANLEEMAVDQVKQVEAGFRRVQELRSACRFDEAMAMLVLLTKNEHSSLAEHVARARQLMLDLAAERDRRRAEAEKDCELARERFAAFDVDGAAEILESVPPPLCKGVVEEFRAEVVARRREIAALQPGAALGGSPESLSRSAAQDRAVIGLEARSCLWPEIGREGAAAPGAGGRKMPGRTSV